jgi:mediator of RNA polymerase II transcription subunit 5
VVSQAILAATAQVIDLETLRGGLSYFSQPLLSWCQIGILLWLCQEIQRQGYERDIQNSVARWLILGFQDVRTCLS